MLKENIAFQRKPMRNKFAAQCYVCGREVKSGSGHFERNGKGGWQVRHVECESQHYLKKAQHPKPINSYP